MEVLLEIRRRDPCRPDRKKGSVKHLLPQGDIHAENFPVKENTQSIKISIESMQYFEYNIA